MNDHFEFFIFKLKYTTALKLHCHPDSVCQLQSSDKFMKIVFMLHIHIFLILWASVRLVDSS